MDNGGDVWNINSSVVNSLSFSIHVKNKFLSAYDHYRCKNDHSPLLKAFTAYLEDVGDRGVYMCIYSPV